MYLEPSLVFPAPPATKGQWDVKRLNGQEFFLPSSDGTQVHTWLLPRAGAVSTLIFCHGNAESLGILGDELAEVRDRWNVNVVAFDYRGYGKTGGHPSEQAILADARAVGEWVNQNDLFKNQKVLVIGRSLGGAPAIEIATFCKINGLLLERTFASTVEIAAGRYPIFPIRMVMKNQFKSIDKLKTYSGPLLQLHGKADEVIPYANAVKLYEACPSPKKELMTFDDLTHLVPWPEGFWVQGEKFIRDVEGS
jgi:uncharacterized protein